MVDFDDIQVRRRLAEASDKGEQSLRQMLAQVPEAQRKRVLNGASLGLLARAMNLEFLIWTDSPQVLVLVDHGMDPNSSLDVGIATTLLGKACSSGAEALVAGLLQRGADPNRVATPNSLSCLALCATKAATHPALGERLCTLLLSHGAASGDGMDNLDTHPLLHMAAHGALEAALVLVNHGARGVASNGETVLERVRQWEPVNNPREQALRNRWIARVEAAMVEGDLEAATANVRKTGRGARL